jgi:outer membrane protein OmpA-like peptidoglycan-associated protein
VEEIMKRIATSALVLVLATSSLSCSNMSNTKKGAIGGAAAGGAIGGIIGHQSGNTAVGAIIGAAVGGAAGAYIGNYMDKQAAEMQKDLEGATIERVGEGIKITFASGLLFDTNKAELKQASRDNLTDLARILNKYPDTNILIEGHADATGGEEWNLELSKLRAQSVSNYLAGQQVMETRFTTMGYGESQPVASNDTADGRAANRRVEVAIYANDKLKKAAQQKTAG